MLDVARGVVERSMVAADMRVNYALALVKTGEREAARAELRRLVAGGKAVSLDPNLRALLDQR